MAEELSSYFARKREELGAFPGEVADAKRVRELLKQKAADLHVGRLVHCFYTPAQARCQAHLEASKRTEPLTGLCDPDCPNACWAQKDLEAWKLLQWEVDAMLKVNSIPHRQREILRRQQATARRVVKAIGDAGEKKEPARGQVCSY